MAEHPQDVDSNTDTVTDDDTTETEPLGVTVKDVGPARKCLTIEVPASRITGMLGDSYGKLQNSADVPGFRRGRAPRRLIEKRFNSAVRDDVRGQLISESFSQAVEDEKLEVIGEPDVKDVEDIELPESGPLTFEVEVEVAPSFELPTLEGISLTREPADVTGDQIDEELTRLQERLGRSSAVEDAACAEGDVLATEATILAGEDAEDGAEQLGHHPQAMVHVGSKKDKTPGQVVGILVDDLTKKVVGHKAGDTIRLSTMGPSGHEDEKLRDTKITIVLNVQGVMRLEPATPEQVAESFAMENVEKLREYLEGMLKVRATRRQEQALREQVCDHLIEKVGMDLPEQLTGRQSERIIRRQELEMSSWGLTNEQIQQRVAETRASNEQEAQRQLKVFFILTQAAKQLEVEVTDEQVNYQIAAMAAEQRRRPEKLRQEMTRSGQLEHLYLLIRERTTLDKIVEKASITDAEAPKAQKSDAPKSPKSNAPKKKKTTPKSNKTEASD